MEVRLTFIRSIEVFILCKARETEKPSRKVLGACMDELRFIGTSRIQPPKSSQNLKIPLGLQGPGQAIKH